ncbi:copper chaperone PCu(A)C [Planctobacterium marinum]|uniref:Copper chaperone PCu(A)C n=1 Tax=Planctobacterium marinum TaxID=1631968 RepID=A0AA48HRJ8_9ALTE|nr:hypothetical protein MACH26_29280 [Planctobacterium marinum]
MKKVTLWCLLSMMLSGFAQAQSLVVEKAWATPTFAMAKMGAAYGVIANSTEQTISITGLQISPEIAASAELHETYMKGDMASMRQLEFPYELAGGEKLELAPRAKHIMLMGLQKPLQEGMTFDVVFTTKDAENLVMTVTVTAADKHERQPIHKHHH